MMSHDGDTDKANKQDNNMIMITAMKMTAIIL